MPPEHDKRQGITQEIRIAWQRLRQVWQLVAKRDKLTLWGASLVMAVVSACTAGNKKLLGLLVDVVSIEKDTAASTVFFQTMALYLGGIAGLFIIAEALQVLRKYVVQNTTTRIERDRVVQLVGHLLKADLATLGRERIGALHGRISRSVEGFVKFIKLTFQDMLPAFSMATFALLTVFLTNWKIGLVMIGVLPAAWIIVVRQMISQKR